MKYCKEPMCRSVCSHQCGMYEDCKDTWDLERVNMTVKEKEDMKFAGLMFVQIYSGNSVLWWACFHSTEYEKNRPAIDTQVKKLRKFFTEDPVRVVIYKVDEIEEYGVGEPNEV